MPPKKPFRISGELHFNFINDEDLKSCYDSIERVMFEYKSQSMLSIVSVLTTVLRDIRNELADRDSSIPDSAPTVKTRTAKKLRSPAKRRLT